MSSESTTARIVKDLTGMWWPAADADKLRSAADAWTVSPPRPTLPPSQ